MTQQTTRVRSQFDTAFLEDVFMKCRLEEEGVTLEDFLENPWGILASHGQADALHSMEEGHLPLLPAQARVARELEAEEVIASCYRTSPRLVH